MTMAEDYYSILGVPKTASKREIREAYLRLAREQHPDRFRDPGKREQAEQRFQLVNESFNHLRDEKLRREYDKSLERKAMPPAQEAELLYKNGLLQEQSGEYSAALKYYYEAMRLAADKVTYIIAAARILAKDRSKQRQAAELFEQAINKEPNAREPYIELGALFTRSGMVTRAQRIYERGIRELPHDSELRTLQSRAAAQARRGKR
jgi:curved DNA-binding protein CbpA